ncbi:hypothetical protein B0H67DRAFT_504026 [Lasiosphaeris hirsuta]|uniref:HhH-GPD domain-containing protein n=1 Tax=Lasiosphaeris hirsuta TaxID=260670 RepID=A0AA40ECP3_9PEZI|nr:hypothetical protein B0H67DRAFT_504026 [Lasiosphaeris hirsuta]
MKAPVYDGTSFPPRCAAGLSLVKYFGTLIKRPIGVSPRTVNISAMTSKNGTGNMTSLCQQSELMKLMLADQLMYGFDIVDDETRDFLYSVIISGQVPHNDAEELLRLSLMRGVEEWEMVIECATTLNHRALGSENHDGGESSLGEGGKDRKPTSAPGMKRLAKSVSRFWGSPQDGDGKSVAQHGKQKAQPLDPQRVAASGNEQDSFRVARDTNQWPRQPPERAGSADARLQSQSPWATTNNSPEIEREPGSELSQKAAKTAPTVPATAAQHQKRPSPGVRHKHTAKSPFFTTPTPTTSPQQQATTPKKPRPPRGTISSLPIPPLSAPSFGLIQETLADDPFRLLIAVTFLIRTHGRAAIPVFHELMARFPTPKALATANPDQIIELIRPLGLAAVRCAAVQRYARGWVERPPLRGMRYGVKNYPKHGDGREVRVGGVFGAEDGDGDEHVGDAAEDARRRAVGCAWEIGHLTQGPYALDSWRIFCRDVLLARAEDWKGKGAPEGFQPEWMRVLPQDKELRACLRWMWMQEGWKWDPTTGERQPLPEELRRAVNERRVGYDDCGDLVISQIRHLEPRHHQISVQHDAAVRL